jgi:hypothetical protein
MAFGFPRHKRDGPYEEVASRGGEEMRKVAIIGVFSMLVVAFAASAALAASPHEVPNNPIVCSEVLVEGDPAVRCSGSIAGLGNAVEAVIIQIDADLACRTRSDVNNPGGHLQATTEPIDVRNGRVNFVATTEGADCPPGLVPVVGETATVSVFEAVNGEPVGDPLFETTVPITPLPTDL